MFRGPGRVVVLRPGGCTFADSVQALGRLGAISVTVAIGERRGVRTQPARCEASTCNAGSCSRSGPPGRNPRRCAIASIKPDPPPTGVADTSTFGHGSWTESAWRVSTDPGSVRKGLVSDTASASLDQHRGAGWHRYEVEGVVNGMIPPSSTRSRSGRYSKPAPCPRGRDCERSGGTNRRIAVSRKPAG